MDSFRESMDSYRSHESWLQKDSFRDWRIRIRFVSWVTNPSCFQKIRFVDLFRRLIFKRFDLFLRILSTIARNESLKIKIRESESLRILKIRIRESRFVTPNLKDSYRGFVFERFVSWKPKSQITRFVSIRKDSYTNPASLNFTHDL